MFSGPDAVAPPLVPYVIFNPFLRPLFQLVDDTPPRLTPRFLHDVAQTACSLNLRRPSFSLRESNFVDLCLPRLLCTLGSDSRSQRRSLSFFSDLLFPMFFFLIELPYVFADQLPSDDTLEARSVFDGSPTMSFIPFPPR